MAMEKLWSALIHLGGNMWNEEGNWNGRAGQPGALASPVLRCDRDLWNKYMEDLVRVGGNAVNGSRACRARFFGNMRAIDVITQKTGASLAERA